MTLGMRRPVFFWGGSCKERIAYLLLCPIPGSGSGFNSPGSHFPCPGTPEHIATGPTHAVTGVGALPSPVMSHLWGQLTFAQHGRSSPTAPPSGLR